MKLSGKQGELILKDAKLLLLIAFFTIPIFRSGGRSNLTGFQWLKEHTVFGSPIQYVPSEDYARELENIPEEEYLLPERLLE